MLGFKGKRNRKMYFLVMVVVNFICLYLFEFLNTIDRFFVTGNVPFIVNKSILNSLSDIFIIICLFGFVVVIWLFFCNKIKRARDIGFSVKWIFVLELIRYFLIFQSFFVVPTFSGDIKNLLVFTNYYKFWVYIMPVVLGFIPGDLKTKILRIKIFLKGKRKNDTIVIEDEGIIDTEQE